MERRLQGFDQSILVDGPIWAKFLVNVVQLQ